MTVWVSPRTSALLLGGLIQTGCGSELKPDKPLPFPDTPIEKDSGTHSSTDASADATPDSFTDSIDAAMDTCVSERCESGLLDANRGTPPSALCISFEEIHADVGLRNSGLLNGLSVMDYDDTDGPDLYLLGNGRANQLFQNQISDFQAAGTQSGLSVGGDHRAAAWADYDGDGDQDVFITGDSGSTLYKNENGIFRPLGMPAGIADTSPGKAAVFLGSDLFLSTINGTRFYRYLGGDNFQEDSLAVGLDDFDDAEAIAAGDYDGDGREDIYLVKSVGMNRLFHQLSDGTFESKQVETGTVGSGQNTDGAWVHYTGEAKPSLYISTWGQDSASPRNLFFVNQGDDTFVNRADELGIHDPGNTTRIAWGDALNEERPFLFLGRWDQSNLLYIPQLDGDGNVIAYTEASHPLGMDETGQTNGAAWLDYNQDDQLDLVVTMANGALFLYRNISHEVKLCPGDRL